MESTIKDVAKLAGTSLMTVSRVLDGSKNVAPETRGKIRWAIKKLHYRPHRTAIELRTKRSNLVGTAGAECTPRQQAFRMGKDHPSLPSTQRSTLQDSKATQSRRREYGDTPRYRPGYFCPTPRVDGSKRS